jgi:tetrahydromethanopterin S-methyltransferase subunit C
MTEYNIPTRASVIMELILAVITMLIIGVLTVRRLKRGARK